MIFRVLSLCLALAVSVHCTCPDPSNLPGTYSSTKFFCARMYENSNSNGPQNSCYGAQLDAYNGQQQPSMPSGWNDKVSSMVVRPGCTLVGYMDSGYGGSRKEYTGMTYYLSKGSGFNNDDMSSYTCSCEYSNEPLTCVPYDTTEVVTEATNLKDGAMEINYQVQQGISLGNSVTYGKSVSESFSFLSSTFEGIFSSELGYTVNYDWSTSSSRDFSKVVTYSITCDVPVGATVQLKQVVGICGDTKVHTAKWYCD